MKEEEFIFRPLISPSDKDFRDKVGIEAWEIMKSKALRDNDYKCCGCGFTPYDVDPSGVLDIHIVEVNKESLEDSETRTMCKLCHVIEHADVAMDKGFVELVNSYFTQGEIVNICRNKEVAHHIENGEIRYIKKPIQEFLEELNSGRAKEGKVKFVLTEKYLNSIGIY